MTSSPSPLSPVSSQGEAVIVIGAGPAGLAAAWDLAQRRIKTIVLEADLRVGGLCQTVECKGYRFDLGGHRFFTRDREIETLWRDTLGADLLRRPRQSRIFYRGRFFQYPLQPWDVIRSLGLGETLGSAVSFLAAKSGGEDPEASLEAWFIRRFGRRLYQHFFRDYTEKVWGRPCREIEAEWGAKRIKGLDFGRAVRAAFFPPPHGSVKSLIREFDYPRLGPGQMYETLAARCLAAGVPVRLRHTVTRLFVAENRVTAVGVKTPEGETRLPARAVLSSLPLPELVAGLTLEETPAGPAAKELLFRSLVTANLMLPRAAPAPDTWLYIHDPALSVGRIQFFRNWSPAMVPRPEAGSMGFEYFTEPGEASWSMGEDALVARARAEAERLGLLAPGTEAEGLMLRARHAYPVYRLGFRRHVAAIREELRRIPNLLPIGRSALFRYDNMDQAMRSGLTAARRLAGETVPDPWEADGDDSYIEG